MASEQACNTIVVVEDDTDIRETLRQLLELEGYTVFCATNGKEGVEVLQSIDRPCLVLLDLMMPVMNGWEFLEAKKANDKLATIPVIVVSAAGERAKSVEAHGFLKKPLELEALLETVKEYCK